MEPNQQMPGMTSTPMTPEPSSKKGLIIAIVVIAVIIIGVAAYAMTRGSETTVTPDETEGVATSDVQGTSTSATADDGAPLYTKD